MRTSVLALAFAMAAGAAQAATLTFENLGEGTAEDWEEDGFTGYGGYFYTPGAGTLHGPAGPMDFDAYIMRDDPFTPISIQIAGSGAFNYDAEGNQISLPYENLIFSGFREGALVAETRIVLGATPRRFTHTFDSDFRSIDRLMLEIPYDAQGPNGEFCDDCSRLEYDNLDYTLAPVPLPLPAGLLLGGLAMLGLLRARRK